MSVYDLSAARARFEVMPGFQPGMSKLEVANVAAGLQEAFSGLRIDNPCDSLSVHVMLLKKMPTSLADQVRRDRVRALRQAVAQPGRHAHRHAR